VPEDRRPPGVPARPLGARSPGEVRRPAAADPRPAGPRPKTARPVAPRPAGPRRRLAARLPRPTLPALPWRTLLFWPVALTSAVTVLRLVGELLRWPEAHFSRLPGGGLATVGITWLVPGVGLWIGWTLGRAGERPADAARAAWQPLGALLVGGVAAAILGRLAHTGWTANLLLWAAASALVAVASVAAWPAAGAALVAYAVAARGLVVLVMALAIARGLGTHYDAVPPGFPAMGRLARFLLLGLLPQATIWVAFTVAVGLCFAALGRLAARRAP
jgi:hypothetical protein